MSTLIFCPQTQAQLNLDYAKLLQAVSYYNEPIHFMTIGEQSEQALQMLPNNPNITAYAITLPNGTDTNNPEIIATCIEHLVNLTKPTRILASSNTSSKQFLPIIAAKHNVSMQSDVVAIVDNDTIERPMYAGDFIAKVKILDDVAILSIRTSAFKALEIEHTGCKAQQIKLDDIASPKVNFSQTVKATKQNDLTNAKIVISAGRGLEKAENFKLIHALAKKLNAAVGATRAAVDAGWIDNSYQIGQTGKIISPKLYLAFGVSGAIQHLAGIKDSETIVAINTDNEAPIMSFADYSLEASLFDVIPELIEQL